MPTRHTVRQGECLSSIAAQYGFSDYKVIYDHPDNADLKKKRPNPNLIYPGDVIVIPDRAPKEVDAAAGKLHSFKLKVPQTKLRLLLDFKEKHHYELSVGDQVWSGTADENAPIEHDIPALATAGKIDLWPATDGNEEKKEGLFSWALQIGSLDPVEEVAGVQGRLSNLGYYVGPIDGSLSDLTVGAICAFQEQNGLDITGEVNDELRSKLFQLHDEA